MLARIALAATVVAATAATASAQLFDSCDVAWEIDSVPFTATLDNTNNTNSFPWISDNAAAATAFGNDNAQ